MMRLVLRTLRVCQVYVSACVLLGCAHRAQPDMPAASAATSARAPQPPAALPADAPELIEVRVLTVAYKDTQRVSERTREQAEHRARMLSSLAREGERLSQLVTEYSDRPGASSDRGVVRVRTADPAPFDTAFVVAALALPVGGVSDPLDQADGFVIVERMADPPAGPERIAAKHILIGYADSPKSVGNVTRSEAEARTLAEQVMREVQAQGADWDALASKYTDEEAGKTTGGDLGKFGRGQMVPSFERAAFSLKVGQISEIVKSPFGFHIIRRYE
ncbi:MAG TPA: peptidylprolyl isomerase [Polyangiales bacterium]|nr:peptidylprolyl isomerase [Polyangiales bacterium]